MPKGRRGKKQPLKPLIDGHRATCPRCRHEMDLLALEVLPEIPAYMDETAPVLRCPDCGWRWALRSQPAQLPRRTPS